MPISDNAIVLGVTGAFGSGCSILSTALQTDLGFSKLKISDLITDEWRDREVAKGNTGGLETPPRGILQDIGDELRKDRHLGYWVERAIATFVAGTSVVDHIVLDGIRNPGEVEWLRSNFNNFYLVAVDAHPDTRWRRLQRTSAWRDRSRQEYDAISARDVEAPQDWGQRVQQCVDLADYLITNDYDDVPPKVHAVLLEAASDFLKLCGEPHRRPTDEELFMHLAYSTASGSACLKRNVGAVIVKPGGKRPIAIDRSIGSAASIESVGFNENPDWMQPCYLEYRACFRDMWRIDMWRRNDYKHCPHCGSSLVSIKWPYNCPNANCNSGGSLLESFFPERAMTKCTALHAEVRAIQAARGRDLSGTHLYATTVPCFLCSEQVLQAGITQVVYVEPYPDVEAEKLLRDHGVAIRRFFGVKSLAFARFFAPWRPEAERQATSRVEIWSSEPQRTRD
jgi:dCMP deaminase